jgi:hypothetical protein
MIELIVLNYLKNALGTPVYLEIPENAPEQFVLLDKTGSSRSNRIESATFAIQSYAESMYKAAQLNDRVKAAMDAMPYTEDVGRAQLNSDYNYTDTTSKRYRYQAVYDLTY